MVINKTLDDSIEEFDIIPFLFAGSGISRRYYNSPDWIGLLKQFNDDPYAFRFYEDTVSFRETPYGLNPAIASLIEEDYNKEWFKNKTLRTLDDNYLDKVMNGCSPFKAEISFQLKQRTILNSDYKEEVKLKKICKEHIKDSPTLAEH